MGSSEDNSNVEEVVIQKINENFGDDPLKLEECDEIRKEYTKEKQVIENSLLVGGSDVPSKISTALQHVQKTLDKVKSLSDSHVELNKSVEVYEEKVNKVKTLVADYVNEINTLEKACDYLNVINEIEKISSSLESGISDKNEKNQVSNYLMLCDIHKSLANTKCNQLLSYANNTVHYWHNVLKEKFVADYEEILKALKWPFTEVMKSNPSADTLNRFQVLTEYLLQIELEKEKLITSQWGTEFEPLSLPIFQLIKPLKKRFVYFFMGNKPLNRADKPEWFFTQILRWITHHQDFIEKNVQPVYDRFQRKGVPAKIEFIRGFVQIAIEKLGFEFTYVHYDDSLFSHCIDEALGFDKELKNDFGYPSTQLSVVEILTQAKIFVKWINMEKRFALEKMDVLLASPTAFNPLISVDVDENLVTECGNSFLTLLSAITERYELLVQPGHKLQFLELQLELIDDFRVRLLQKLWKEESEPLDSQFPNILNTVNYVRDVLHEWGTNTLFLRLQYYKTNLEGIEPTGTVFDKYLIRLGKMRDDLLMKLTENVFMDVKAKSMPYRKNRWHAMESIKNVLKPTVTPTACPMFQILITKLHKLQKVLAVSLFERSWKILAQMIDEFLYEEIVSICVFNEGGALQFDYDVTKNLFPLFGQYSKNPAASFKLLKDSCVLLSMTKGMALSLKQTLTEKHEDGYDVSEVLTDVGIYTLNQDEVLSLLSRRSDLE